MKIKQTILTIALIFTSLTTLAGVTDSTLKPASSRAALDNITANPMTSNNTNNINNSNSYITHNTNNANNKIYNPYTGADISDTVWPGYTQHIGKSISLKYKTTNTGNSNDVYAVDLTAWVDAFGQPNLTCKATGSKGVTFSSGSSEACHLATLTASGLSSAWGSKIISKRWPPF